MKHILKLLNVIRWNRNRLISNIGIVDILDGCDADAEDRSDAVKDE